jgi:hypothetical protein
MNNGLFLTVTLDFMPIKVFHFTAWSNMGYSEHKTFWPVEKLAELVEGPTLCHVRRQGQAICFVLSVNPIRSSVHNFALMVLSAANKKTSVK